MAWEYRVLQADFAERWSPKKQAAEVEKLEDLLNTLGAEGWEMISYESIPMYGAFTKTMKGMAYLLFLKRERS